jgi:hypothetical protein
MWRILCLQLALTALIHSMQFRELLKDHKNNRSIQGAIMDIESKEFWARLYYLLRMVMPALLLLRFSVPMMDKLYHSTYLTAEYIKRSKKYLDDKNIFDNDCDLEIDFEFDREMGDVFGEGVSGDGEGGNVDG